VSMATRKPPAMATRSSAPHVRSHRTPRSAITVSRAEASNRGVLWRVTVAVQIGIHTGPRDASTKSVRVQVDMHAAYREVGSCCAAVAICGTTPKTIEL
jgi:hypothetical protein